MQACRKLTMHQCRSPAKFLIRSAPLPGQLLLRNSPGMFPGNEVKAHCLRLGTEFGLLAFVIAELIGSESAIVELLVCGH
jgi:hypothetical protein